MAVATQETTITLTLSKEEGAAVLDVLGQVCGHYGATRAGLTGDVFDALLPHVGSRSDRGEKDIEGTLTFLER